MNIYIYIYIYIYNYNILLIQITIIIIHIIELIFKYMITLNNNLVFIFWYDTII